MKWIWKDDGINLGSWECPYCNEIAHYNLKFIDDDKSIYTCPCGRKFKFEWDTCPDGEGGSNLVVALTEEI